MFKSTGRLVYDPKARIKLEPYWAILKCDPEIIKYYQYWIKRHYDLEFEKTVWGSHISVNRGTVPNNKEYWGKYVNEQIKFTYSEDIYRVHWFFCIDVKCERMGNIREELGLSKEPSHGFHLTVGRINKPYLERKKDKWNEFLSDNNIPVNKFKEPLLPMYSYE